MNNVLKFINDLDIKENDYVVVACSFGPDSMFLLNLLNKYNFKVVCAHVNHKMRLKSEEEFIELENFCKKNNIIFEGTEILNYEDSDNFHDFARNFRYNFFESIVKKYHAKYLFTAHHGDDLIETILMRILRGGSIYSYLGFSSIVEKDGYKIARPLIYLTKDEIEQFDKEENIPYSVDESNLEDHYTRNRFRHHVLPFLKSEEKLAHEKFLQFNENLKECTTFLDKYCYSLIDKIYVNNVLDLNEFKKQDIYIKKDILYKILMSIYNNDIDEINSKHINLLLDIIENDKPNLEIYLPRNIHVLKEYNKLTFKIAEVSTNYDYILNNEVNTPLGNIIRISESDEKSNYVIRLNSKDISLPIHVRNKMDGDKMEVKNMNGSKKVSDIFIDEKVDASKRKITPLVVDHDENILWIPGIKKSKFDIEKNEVYDIILKYEKGEE